MAQQGMKMIKEGEWTFFQFSGAPTVVIAERKFTWYDQEKFNDASDALREQKCRVFMDESDENSQYYKQGKRKHTRFEVYKKYKDKNFQRNAEELLRQLEELFDGCETL